MYDFTQAVEGIIFGQIVDDGILEILVLNKILSLIVDDQILNQDNHVTPWYIVLYEYKRNMVVHQ